MNVLVLVGIFASSALIEVVFFFFNQKTAYEMRISDWSSDVCSSDLLVVGIGIHGTSLRRSCGLTLRQARHGESFGDRAEFIPPAPLADSRSWALGWPSLAPPVGIGTTRAVKKANVGRR